MISALLLLIQARPIDFLEPVGSWKDISAILADSMGGAIDVRYPLVVSEDGKAVLIWQHPNPHTESMPEVKFFEVGSSTYKPPLRLDPILLKAPEETLLAVGTASFELRSRRQRVIYRFVDVLAAEDPENALFLASFKRADRLLVGLHMLNLPSRSSTVHPVLPGSNYKLLQVYRAEAFDYTLLFVRSTSTNTVFETWQVKREQLKPIALASPLNPYRSLSGKVLPRYLHRANKSTSSPPDRLKVAAIDVTSPLKALYVEGAKLREYELTSKRWTEFRAPVESWQALPFYWQERLYVNLDINPHPTHPAPTYVASDDRSKWRSLAPYRIVGRSASGNYWVVISDEGTKAWLARGTAS
jgi:hypothetical protein